MVKTDAATTSAKATEMAASIKAVDMNKLSAEEHTVWMKVMQNLITTAESIAKSKRYCKTTGYICSTFGRHLHKAYKKIPQILSFGNEQGEDEMKQQIGDNYRQIKSDVVNIVESEMERIKNDHNLKHLLQSN